MANEITVSGKLSILKGKFKEDVSPPSLKGDLSSIIAAGGTQNIGTSVEALAKGDVSTAGYGFFRNAGDTYNVKIGGSSNGTTGGTIVYLLLLKPGEYAITRLATPDVMALAVSGATDLQYYLFSE